MLNRANEKIDLSDLSDNEKGYDFAMFELECEAEKMACERNISKQEAREIICERYDYDFDEGDFLDDH